MSRASWLSTKVTSFLGLQGRGLENVRKEQNHQPKRRKAERLERKWLTPTFRKASVFCLICRGKDSYGNRFKSNRGSKANLTDTGEMKAGSTAIMKI
jgi:hypothetical protein